MLHKGCQIQIFIEKALKCTLLSVLGAYSYYICYLQHFWKKIIYLYNVILPYYTNCTQQINVSYKSPTIIVITTQLYVVESKVSDFRGMNDVGT